MKALRMLDRARARLWRAAWRAEALEVAIAQLSVARGAKRPHDEIRIARWMCAQFPQADSYLVLGDAYHVGERAKDAVLAWKRAETLAGREKSISIKRIARAQLQEGRITSVENTVSTIVERALLLARTDKRRAADELLSARRRMLRVGGTADAAQLLRLSVSLFRDAGDLRRARMLLRPMEAHPPSAADALLCAEVRLANGECAQAHALARRAKRLAQREGALTLLIRANVVATTTVASEQIRAPNSSSPAPDQGHPTVRADRKRNRGRRKSTMGRNNKARSRCARR